MKSIMARYQSLKEKGFDEEDGTKVNNVSKALAEVGISMVDAQGQFANFGTVMDELGAKWQYLDSRQRAYIATTLAGTYQQSRFLNLMNGYSQSVDLYKNALNDAGVAQEKFNRWQQGTEAALDKFKSAVEGIWQNLFNSNQIQQVIYTLTGLVNSINSIIERFGALNSVLVAGVGAFSLISQNFRNFTASVTNGIPVIGDLSRYLNAITTSFKNQIESEQQKINVELKNIETIKASTLSIKEQAVAIDKANTNIKSAQNAIAGLTVKQVAATAASIALQTALSMGLSLAITGLITLITNAITAHQKLLEKQQEIAEAQQNFRKAVDDFNNSLDPSKIKGVTEAYENLKKAMNVDETAKKIEDLKRQIADLKASTGDINTVTDRASAYAYAGSTQAIGEKQKKLQELQDELDKLINQQNLYDEAQKRATAIDYESVEVKGQQIAQKVVEANANAELINTYQDVYNKLKDGIKLTQQEEQLNNQLMSQYPQYIRLLNETTRQRGVDYNSLNKNLSLQQAVAQTEFDSFRMSVAEQQVKTEKLREETQKRIDIIKKEIEVNESYQNFLSTIHGDALTLSLAQQAREAFAQLEREFQAKQNDLDAYKRSLDAYDVILNANPKDLLKQAQNTNSLNNDDKDATKAEALQVQNLTDELIKAFNAQAKITEEQGKSLQNQIKIAEKQKDYNKEIELTNQLIGNQKQQIVDLQDAQAKMHNEAEYLRNSNSQYDTESWFDTNGQATYAYKQFLNTFASRSQDIVASSLSEKEKKALIDDLKNEQSYIEKLFDSLSKLKQGYMANNDAISQINETINGLNTNRANIFFAQLDAQLTPISKDIDMLDKQFQLLDEGNLEGQTTLKAQKLEKTQEAIQLITKQLEELRQQQATNTDNTELYTQKIDELTGKLFDYQVTVKQTSQELYESEINTVKEVQDKIIDLLKKKYDAEAKLREKQHQDTIDGLDEDLNDYKDYISKKLALLDDEYNQEDYIKNVNDEEQNKLEIQKQINELSLDDSIESQSKLKDLKKQLADEQDKIDDLTTKRERDLRKKNLQDAQSQFEKMIKDKKDAEDKSYNDFKANMEKQTSDVALQMEAQKMLTTQSFADLKTNYLKLENEFGDGLGILGNKIKTEFISKIEEATKAVQTLYSVSTDSTILKDNELPDAVVGVRKKLEENNYTVGWDDEARKIIVSKGNMTKTLLDSDVAKFQNIDGSFYGKIKDIQDALKHIGFYKTGGLITENQFAQLHGTEQDWEAVLTKPQIAKLVSDTINQTVNRLITPSFNVANPALNGTNRSVVVSIEKLVNIEGNVDRSLLPDIDKAVQNGLNKVMKEMFKSGFNRQM